MDEQAVFEKVKAIIIDKLNADPGCDRACGTLPRGSEGRFARPGRTDQSHWRTAVK